MITSILSSILIFLSSLFAPISLYFFPPVPCEKPITYHIGQFDKQFDVSQADFLSALSEAEAIWEKPIGKDLFAYDEAKGKLTINLIYDYRQEATNELQEIKGAVNQDDKTYKYLENQYNSLKAQHDTLQAAYDAKVAQFKADQARYEEKLAEWNAGPRTSRAEFNDLENERVLLQNELQDVKATEIKLNSVVAQVNTLVVQLNNVAKTLNLQVKQYNTIGASRGDTFAGGIYTSDASGERIDIFEFENHAKLVRVLAHELGHALGLDHIDDPEAIMYKLNEGDAAKPTSADLTALKALCQMK